MGGCQWEWEIVGARPGLSMVRLARNHPRDTINAEAVPWWVIGDWDE